MPTPVFRQANALGIEGYQTTITQNIQVPEGLHQILLVVTSTRETTAVSSVTFNAQALTFLSAINSGSNNCRAELWYMKYPPAEATHELKATWPSNVHPAIASAVFRSVYLDSPFRYTETDPNYGASPVRHAYTMGNGNASDVAVQFMSWWDDGYLATPTIDQTGQIKRTSAWNLSSGFSSRTFCAIATQAGNDNGSSFAWASSANFAYSASVYVSLRGLARSPAMASWFT